MAMMTFIAAQCVSFAAICWVRISLFRRSVAAVARCAVGINYSSGQKLPWVAFGYWLDQTLRKKVERILCHLGVGAW